MRPTARRRYDRYGGRLSGFILTILRSRALDLRRQVHGRHEVHASADSVDQMSDADLERLWLDERQGQILRQAMEELQASGLMSGCSRPLSCGPAGRGHLGGDHPAWHVAREVYNAKYRITRALQPIVARLDELYEDI
ncbi:MAG: hypothetical protein IPJ41_07205 [Phycisphaerales bacterium]|nr:hypothetical protein [Phycisphaerales bacterium]